MGADITAALPSEVTVEYNDGTKDTASVSWNSEEIAAIVATEPIPYMEQYLIPMKVEIQRHCIQNAKYPYCRKTCCSRAVLKMAQMHGLWKVLEQREYPMKHQRTGNQEFHYYIADSAIDFTLTQSITAAQSGVYSSYLYIQGSADTAVELTLTNDTQKTSQSDTANCEGWKIWQQPKQRVLWQPQETS